MDNFLQDNISAQTKRYPAAIGSLSVEFKECVWYFAAIEKGMLLLSSPFNVEPNDASLQLQCDNNFLLTFTSSWIKAGF